LPGITHVAVDSTGLVRGTGMRPVRAEYTLTDIDTVVAGTLVARRDRAGMVVYRTSGDLTVRQRVDGLYPDRWSGPQVVFQRFGCGGGIVNAQLRSDPVVHDEAVTVTASVTGGGAYTATVPPRMPTLMRVPLRSRGGACTVTYTVPTRTPALESASTDTRALGLKFAFSYEPPA
jgi:hypothetical protein